MPIGVALFLAAIGTHLLFFKIILQFLQLVIFFDRFKSYPVGKHYVINHLIFW
jgi:hypothetical protein